MKPYEFATIYTPSAGKFVYKHKGSGLILDNIFKPLKTVAKSVVKPLAKKVHTSEIDHTGKKIGEKSGDLIMKRLENLSRIKSSGQKTVWFAETPNKTTTDDILINRLISGSGQ